MYATTFKPYIDPISNFCSSKAEATKTYIAENYEATQKSLENTYTYISNGLEDHFLEVARMDIAFQACLSGVFSGGFGMYFGDIPFAHDSFRYTIQCAVLGVALTVVNAVVRPIFDAYFDEHLNGRWNQTKVFAETAAVIGIVALSFFLCPPLLSLITAEQLKASLVSAACIRIYYGLWMTLPEGGDKIAEGKTTAYKYQAIIWVVLPIWFFCLPEPISHLVPLS